MDQVFANVVFGLLGFAIVVGIPVLGIREIIRRNRATVSEREAIANRRKVANIRKLQIEEQAKSAKSSIAAWRMSHREVAYVYVTEFVSDSYWGGQDNPFSKVGISKGDVHRTRQHENNGHRIIRTWEVPSLAVARAVEREALDWARFSTGFDARRDASFLQEEMGQGGYTEMTVVPSADLAAAVDESIRHFTADTERSPIVPEPVMEKATA